MASEIGCQQGGVGPARERGLTWAELPPIGEKAVGVMVEGREKCFCVCVIKSGLGAPLEIKSGLWVSRRPHHHSVYRATSQNTSQPLPQKKKVLKALLGSVHGRV